MWIHTRIKFSVSVNIVAKKHNRIHAEQSVNVNNTEEGSPRMWNAETATVSLYDSPAVVSVCVSIENRQAA